MDVLDIGAGLKSDPLSPRFREERLLFRIIGKKDSCPVLGNHRCRKLFEWKLS